MIPETRRTAFHQAGHAMVQTIVGSRRFVVNRVSIDVEPVESWRGFPTRGETTLDREVVLGLYEFGLVTLSGISAEERYLADELRDEEPLIALSDLAAWQEKARDVLQSETRLNLVSSNVVRRLQEWMEDESVWRVVECLADALLAEGTLQGEPLRQILSPLFTGIMRWPEHESISEGFQINTPIYTCGRMAGCIV
jgi:hypothetical protein